MGGQIFEPQRPQSFYTEITEKSPCLWCFFLRELCGLSILSFTRLRNLIPMEDLLPFGCAQDKLRVRSFPG